MYQNGHLRLQLKSPPLPPRYSTRHHLRSTYPNPPSAIFNRHRYHQRQYLSFVSIVRTITPPHTVDPITHVSDHRRKPHLQPPLISRLYLKFQLEVQFQLVIQLEGLTHLCF